MKEVLGWIQVSLGLPTVLQQTWDLWDRSLPSSVNYKSEVSETGTPKLLSPPKTDLPALGFQLHFGSGSY